MGVGKALRSLLLGQETIRVHLLVRGRIGEGWIDVDTTLKVPPGTTLQQFIEKAEERNIPLGHAIENSPHLRHTLMWNGERCPLAENAERELQDQDELYLLAPIAGG
jgi:molybdopterin converting factor small subunit